VGSYRANPYYIGVACHSCVRNINIAAAGRKLGSGIKSERNVKGASCTARELVQGYKGLIDTWEVCHCSGLEITLRFRETDYSPRPKARSIRGSANRIAESRRN
jgi:hypothetical protein